MTRKAVLREFPFDQLHTVQAVASRLSVSERQVYAWQAEGKLDGFKLGGALRISESSVLRFLDFCRVNPEDVYGEGGV